MQAQRGKKDPGCLGLPLSHACPRPMHLSSSPVLALAPGATCACQLPTAPQETHKEPKSVMGK